MFSNTVFLSPGGVILRLVLQDALRAQLNYRGRLKWRDLARALWPRRFPFDLPPSATALPLSHSPHHSIPASPPSQQMKERGRLHQRNVISSVNVAAAQSLSFSHHFTHKCFLLLSSFFFFSPPCPPPFFSLLFREADEGRRQPSGQAGG